MGLGGLGLRIRVWGLEFMALDLRVRVLALSWIFGIWGSARTFRSEFWVRYLGYGLFGWGARIFDLGFWKGLGF